MEITTSLWTLIHGMGFETLYLLAGSGAIVELYRQNLSDSSSQSASGGDRFLGFYLAVMAAYTTIFLRSAPSSLLKCV